MLKPGVLYKISPSTINKMAWKPKRKTCEDIDVMKRNGDLFIFLYKEDSWYYALFSDGIYCRTFCCNGWFGWFEEA
jgi:hypothetical protein